MRTEWLSETTSAEVDAEKGAIVAHELYIEERSSQGESASSSLWRYAARMSLGRVRVPSIIYREEPSFHDALEPKPQSYECDLCGQSFEGRPEGSGLLLWTRGDEVRYDERPLCPTCAQSVTLGAFFHFMVTDDEEEG